MADNEDYYGSELISNHQTLRIIGLAPYYLGSTLDDTHLNKFMVMYNILLATFVLGNVWYSETDDANSVTYSNKTEVVDIAYDTVDIIGNIYVFIFVTSAVLRYKKSCALYFMILKNNDSFRKIGITFDRKKMRLWFYIKLGILLIVSALVMTATIWLDESSGNHYTILYWTTVLHPRFIAAVVVLVFGSCILSLEQKIWTVNELIRVFMKAYEDHQEREKVIDISDYLHYDERLLEKFVMAQQTKKKYFINSWTKIQPEENCVRHRKPITVMINNFPQCFVRTKCDILKELRRLRHIQFEVFALGADINCLFGPHFLFVFVIYFFGCTINLYSTVTFHVINVTSGEYASCVLWTIIYLALISYIVRYCNTAASQANETKILIHKFWTKIHPDDQSFDRELQSFAMQLAYNPLEFNAAGFFPVDCPILFSFVVGVISNVIFIVQFDKLNLRGAPSGSVKSQPMSSRGGNRTNSHT